MLGSLIPFSSKIAFVTKLSVRIPAVKLALCSSKNISWLLSYISLDSSLHKYIYNSYKNLSISSLILLLLYITSNCFIWTSSWYKVSSINRLIVGIEIFLNPYHKVLYKFLLFVHNQLVVF